MPRFRAVRHHLIELVVVFVGVVLAFAVENLREDLNDRHVSDQYLSGFRQDLLADSVMLEAQRESRQAQLDNALTVLQFFEGRPIDPAAFFEAYYPALLNRHTAPNRNTMDEVLNSGNLRLIRDAGIRTRLLDLYATYDRVADLEEHMARDFDQYLYDPTFTSIPIQIDGPWEDTPANHRAVQTLLDDVTIENGIRLLVANILIADTGLLAELESAQSQVESLLQMVPPD